MKGNDMHTPARTCTLIVASMALALSGLSACSSAEGEAGSGETTVTSSLSNNSESEQGNLVADIRWSEFITPEEFEERWQVNPGEAIYDASRTRYTTPAEFRESHEGESHEEWYPRVAKKDYESYVQEKIDDIEGASETK